MADDHHLGSGLEGLLERLAGVHAVGEQKRLDARLLERVNHLGAPGRRPAAPADPLAPPARAADPLAPAVELLVPPPPLELLELLRGGAPDVLEARILDVELHLAD